MKQKTAVITGGTGFIGSHLCKRLKDKGYWVRVVDIKHPEFEKSCADEVVILDLAADKKLTREAFLAPYSYSEGVDEAYNLACLMGGAGFIFTGLNDSLIMANSAACNINSVEACRDLGVKKVFYSSSACIYPQENQEDPDNPNCAESSAYPANPDSAYGFEKLFSENLYSAFQRNHGMNIKIARFHNIFGPLSVYDGGKEKAPAAVCRKVLESDGEIEIWGDGKQTRSFLYIDECLEAVDRLMAQEDFSGPVNIGSEEMISINDLARMAIDISGKKISIRNIEGDEFAQKYGFPCPVGVRGRNSDNRLYREKMGWAPSAPLRDGMEKTFEWIKKQMS